MTTEPENPRSSYAEWLRGIAAHFAMCAEYEDDDAGAESFRADAATATQLAPLMQEAEELWRLTWTGDDTVLVGDVRERLTALFTALAAGFAPLETR